MFANLFFLILNLLLVLTTTELSTSFFFNSRPEMAFILYLCSFALLLPFLYLGSSFLFKNCKCSIEFVVLTANIILLLFFSFFYFFLGSGRFLIDIFRPFSNSGFGIFSLLLYFTGFFVCHYSIERCRNQDKAFKQALLAVRFLIPVVLPFVVLNFLSDASTLFPMENFFNLLKNHTWIAAALFVFLNLVIILLTLILLPPLSVIIWGCPNLAEGELKSKLDQLCREANFKHAGFRIWNIMNHSMTAAIIGVFSPLRYVLFTQKLLDHVPDRCIIAILAHEIGHSYYRHLYFYPFILMGMIIFTSLTYTFAFVPFLEQINPESFLFQAVPLLSFLLFGFLMALYFRYVFGYFSRQFERQADLHIFNLDCPAKDMIEALDILGKWGGDIHLNPNWHHHSIQQRMDFLEVADKNRLLVENHAKKVRWSLIIYFVFLVFAFGLLF